MDNHPKQEGTKRDDDSNMGSTITSSLWNLVEVVHNSMMDERWISEIFTKGGGGSKS